MTERIDPTAVGRVACIGSGTIGGGWAAFFLSRGLDVVASDPGPDAEATLRGLVARVWPRLTQLGLAPGADPGRLTFESDPEAALAGVEFVQESAPDREDLKIDLFERMGRVLPASVVIASSSSTFVPTSIASRCAAPERVIVGHPFTPSYLMPLVEVVGGEKTAPAVMDWAMAFYRHIGKHPVRLTKEIERYVSNRLQHVVREEIDRLVAAGICGYAEADQALSYGPGMRWAFMGPALGLHFTGGQGGIDAAIAHFGWRGPPALEAQARAAVEVLSHGHEMDRLEAWRDENLIAQLKALKPVPPAEAD